MVLVVELLCKSKSEMHFVMINADIETLLERVTYGAAKGQTSFHNFVTAAMAAHQDSKNNLHMFGYLMTVQ